jgi:hypothetical protein
MRAYITRLPLLVSLLLLFMNNANGLYGAPTLFKSNFVRALTAPGLEIRHKGVENGYQWTVLGALLFRPLVMMERNAMTGRTTHL